MITGVDRFGVRMSPFKAAILDMIKAAPNGISSAELRWVGPQFQRSNPKTSVSVPVRHGAR
jgi:hypothetical protein